MCVLRPQRFEQVAASRNRLATQLSRANRYTAHLEAELAGRSADVSAAAAALAEAGAQLQQLLRQVVLSLSEYHMDKIEHVWGMHACPSCDLQSAVVVVVKASGGYVGKMHIWQHGLRVNLLVQAGLTAGDAAAGSGGGSMQAYALTQALARCQQGPCNVMNPPPILYTGHCIASRCLQSGSMVLLLNQMYFLRLQQLQRQQRKLEQSAVQSVPLVWLGVAQEVRNALPDI